MRLARPSKRRLTFRRRGPRRHRPTVGKSGRTLLPWMMSAPCTQWMLPLDDAGSWVIRLPFDPGVLEGSLVSVGSGWLRVASGEMEFGRTAVRSAKFAVRSSGRAPIQSHWGGRMVRHVALIIGRRRMVVFLVCCFVVVLRLAGRLSSPTRWTCVCGMAMKATWS